MYVYLTSQGTHELHSTSCHLGIGGSHVLVIWYVPSVDMREQKIMVNKTSKAARSEFITVLNVTHPNNEIGHLMQTSSCLILLMLIIAWVTSNALCGPPRVVTAHRMVF